MLNFSFSRIASASMGKKKYFRQVLVFWPNYCLNVHPKLQFYIAIVNSEWLLKSVESHPPINSLDHPSGKHKKRSSSFPRKFATLLLNIYNFILVNL